MEQKRLDVFEQETHSDDKNVADWTQEGSGLSVLRHNSSTNEGAAGLFSRNFTPISFSMEEILAGRLFSLRNS